VYITCILQWLADLCRFTSFAGYELELINLGNVAQINYLAKARSGKMRLIEGDADDFGNILGLIDDYEGQ
jgi:hypothetical protein